MLVLRFTKTHTLNRIINYSTLKIFRVFNFRRNAISTKINYDENFQIYILLMTVEVCNGTRHDDKSADNFNQGMVSFTIAIGV